MHTSSANVSVEEERSCVIVVWLSREREKMKTICKAGARWVTFELAKQTATMWYWPGGREQKGAETFMSKVAAECTGRCLERVWNTSSLLYMYCTCSQPEAEVVESESGFLGC